MNGCGTKRCLASFKAAQVKPNANRITMRGMHPHLSSIIPPELASARRERDSGRLPSQLEASTRQTATAVCAPDGKSLALAAGESAPAE